MKHRQRRRHRAPRPKSARRRSAGHVRRYVAVAFLGLALFLPVVLAGLVLDDRPVVARAPSLDAADAVRVKRLVKRTLERLKRGGASARLRFTEDELNAMAALAGRAVPGLTGRVNMAPLGLEAALAYRLPANPFGRFLNLRAGLVPSRAGLRVSHATLGPLQISGPLALTLARLGGDALLGKRQATALVDAVSAVEINDDALVLHLRAPADIAERLASVRTRVKDYRDELTPLGDPALVRVYYSALLALEDARDNRRPVSLAAFMRPVFAIAVRRSQGGSAVRENRAALLALAMHFGDPRFESLIGEVRTAGMRSRAVPRTAALLAGRTDLALHFIISAGLEIAANAGMANAVGEFKELLDTERRGSGFSFVDLAADRAGARFAEQALAGAGGAERLQAVIASEARESAFFPDIDGLSEGLTRSQFEDIYGGVQGDLYNEVLAHIDRRIRRLPAYGTGSGL